MANYDQGQLLGSLMLVMRELKTWGEEATAGSLYLLLEAGFCSFFGKDTDLTETQLPGHMGFHILKQNHVCSKGLD